VLIDGKIFAPQIMTELTRREFVCSAALAAGSLALNFPRSARAADSRIDVLINEPIATIEPNIYGHFTEHLGAVIYDGIWVGENSKIANINGIRQSLVEALKRIKAPIFRYPGGCFADSYDWRDGVGDRAKRPKRTNFWYGAANKDVPVNSTTRIEPNEFGTNEFMRFCQLVGGKAYLAANLRGLSAQVFNEWMEYCNSPAGSTTLAEQRAVGSTGSREPFRVEYWGIGNESWGCGGELTAEEYGQEFRRFTAAYNAYDVPVKFIGAGASSDDINWTRRFFANMREKSEAMFQRRLFGWGIHHYSWNVSAGRTTDWNDGKGDAVNFGEEQYYELLREADKIDGYIKQHWEVMGEFDRQHHTKIAVDEWGSWHRPGTELKPTHLLGQQNTMRDALVASLSLDAFNRNADKVVMANVAQLVNCLHSLFLADGDRFLLTPTYHIFDMFTPHMGARGVRAVFSSPRSSYQRNGKPADLWGLNGSASMNGKQLTLTVTNSHMSESCEAEIAVRGAAVSSARARVLSHKDVHAHNTFENPRAVTPRDETMRSGQTLVFNFPPASATRLTFDLQ
jgi:alpha-N-arabinofuranosidase